MAENQDQAQDQAQEKDRRNKGVFWELGMVIKENDPTVPTGKKMRAVCKCLIDRENPDSLVEIARKYLCVPASSASSERLFSASGNVVTKLRSSLDPQNLELLVYLHENTRKVKMSYDSTILQAPAQAPAQAEVVAVD
jgi:hypothetical protein